VRNQKYVTETGYETRHNYYQCEDFGECPYAEECKKTEKPKKFIFSHHMNELKKKANENLCSEKGLELRSQRIVEAEQTFGRIKDCWSFQ
jgi:hypothetical protein